jgi:hypothetical protein
MIRAEFSRLLLPVFIDLINKITDYSINLYSQ